MYFTPIPYWKWQIPEALPVLCKNAHADAPTGQPCRTGILPLPALPAAIDERLALLQNGSVIQQPVSFVHGLIAQQGGSAEFRKKDLPGWKERGI